jgi:hypothetical protein
MAKGNRTHVAQGGRVNKLQLSRFQFEEGDFIVVHAECAGKFMCDFGCVCGRQSFGLTLIGKLGERQCGRGQ